MHYVWNHTFGVQVQRAETEMNIHQKQTELASLQARRAVLQSANATAKKRNDKAAATLEATLHITTTILPQCMGSESAVGSHPVPIEASGRQNSDTCMTPTSPAPPQGHHCPTTHPSVAVHAHSDSHAAPKPIGATCDAVYLHASCSVWLYSCLGMHECGGLHGVQYIVIALMSIVGCSWWVCEQVCRPIAAHRRKRSWHVHRGQRCSYQTSRSAPRSPYTATTPPLRTSSF